MSVYERPDTDLVEYAYPYALDAITEHERQEIEERRATADRFAVAEFDAVVAAVREVLADMTAVDSQLPPPELERRILIALDRAMGLADRHESRLRIVIRYAARGRKLAAVGLVLIGIGAGIAGITLHGVEDNPADKSPAALVDSQPDGVTRIALASSGGNLVVHTSSAISLAVIEFHELAALPDGETYQVWLVPLGGSPRSAAILGPVPSRPLVTGFHKVETLAITVEPTGGSNQPTTPPIASINLT